MRGTVAALATLVLLAPGSRAADSPITFNRDIAPILFERCSSCHRPEQSAPFNLLNFEDARKRAKQLARVTRSRFMPPWLAEPGPYPFKGERRLTSAQIQLFQDWYRTGMAEGDPDDLPEAPEWVEGWQRGQPDQVVEMQGSFELPNEAVDVFRNFVIPSNNERPRWIRSVEIRPGNPAVVHHGVLRVDRSFSSRRLAAQDDLPGFGSMNMGDAEAPGGHTISWTPGMQFGVGLEDSAWLLEPGTDLVLQLHMIPSGKTEPVKPVIGLYYADGPPKHELWTIMLRARNIDIPAGEARYLRTDRYVVPTDVELLSVYPHAHYLGKEINSYAVFPDGTRKSLIRIGAWNFDWQEQYFYADPVQLPAGTELHMEYTYDNSRDNLRNPNQPPKRVVSGSQSSDEMGTLEFVARVQQPGDLEKVRESLVRQDVEKDPSDWLAHNNLGIILQSRGQLDEAILEYRKTLAINPTRTAALNNLGLIHQQEGRIEEAREAFQRALSLNPDFASAHYNLGNAFLEENRVDEAVREFKKAVETRPGYGEAHFNLGSVLQGLGRLDDSRQHLERALELMPDDPSAHNNLGSTLALQSRFDLAEPLFRRALELQPSLEDAHINLGTILLERGFLSLAAGRFRQAARLNPGSERAQMNLQLATEMLAEVDVLIPGLERSAQTTHRGNPALLAQLSTLYAAVGRLDDAVRAGEKALELLGDGQSPSAARSVRGQLESYRNARP